MPNSGGSRTAETREQLELELLETLRQRQNDWATASEDRRDYARQQFMNALQNFNSLILYGKTPNQE